MKTIHLKLYEEFIRSEVVHKSLLLKQYNLIFIKNWTRAKFIYAKET